MKSMRPVGPSSAPDHTSIRFPRKNFVHELLPRSAHSNLLSDASEFNAPPVGNPTFFKKDNEGKSVVDAPQEDFGHPARLLNGQSPGSRDDLRPPLQNELVPSSSSMGPMPAGVGPMVVDRLNIEEGVALETLLPFAPEVAPENSPRSDIGGQLLLPAANEFPPTAGMAVSSVIQPGKGARPPLTTGLMLDEVPNTSLDGFVQRGASDSEHPALSAADELSATASTAVSSNMQSGNRLQPLLETEPMIEELPNTSFDGLVLRAASNIAEAATGTEANFPALELPAGIEEQVVTPVGMTQQFLESRVYGVHLLPSAYLSEVSLAVDVPQEIAAVYTTGAQAAHTASRLSDTHGHVSEWTVIDAAQEHALGASPNLFSENEVTDEMVTPSATTRSMASTLASAISWPESLLRLTKNHDGSFVIWLRDFRLNNGDARPVIASLVAQAKARHVVLGRIVLNGREAWVSTSKGDDHVR